MAADSKTFLLRLVKFLVYVLIGAAIFMLIESDEDKNSSTRTVEDLQGQWITRYNLSRENITKMLQDYDRMKEIGAKPRWNFLNSVYFVLQLVTTIGKSIFCVNLNSHSLWIYTFALLTKTTKREVKMAAF